MKYVDEFRDPDAARECARKIADITTQEWTIMEVCGGQTHTIVRFGLQEILPDKINVVHGPGCPVCVTPLEQLDKAMEIAARSDVIFCSFGDMLRVPGSEEDLRGVKAGGGDVRIVYSPLDAVKIAKDNPDKQVVFFAVGFETTAPVNAMAVFQAEQYGLNNFFVLVSHVLVPPAIEAILSSPENRVQGFLAAGHVCAIMGYEEYFPLAEKYKTPIVVTGFEPLDILHGVYMCIKQLEEGRFEVENQYSRVVDVAGNLEAQNLIQKIFKIAPRKWRGIGDIPQSGLVLSDEYERFNAETRFGVTQTQVQEPEECISGLILQGLKRPNECPAFGTICTPEKPLGATMVSGEGACSAYYKYKRDV
ncbi:MAG: hydrogenase formation protein HypD [Alphaproteobacteria bacterium]|nr:hydrogenase formation protein HypD [Alphaproteobacteria bacterium]